VRNRDWGRKSTEKKKLCPKTGSLANTVKEKKMILKERVNARVVEDRVDKKQ